MILPLGTRIDGKYEVRATIGSGGMGIVYEAYQGDLDRLVAVKILTDHLEETDAARFEREALSMSRLCHRNIVRFYGYGQWSQIPYIAMERLYGQSLQQRMSSNAPMDEGEAIEILRQICSGVAHAHSQGVIHRDMKPSNILICEQSTEPNARVKILDFGFAKIAGANIQKLTQTGRAFGSLLYISPEQALGQHADARTDIYGVGCILFQCLTGVPPFSGDNAAALLFQHVHESISQAERWKDIPKPFQQIIAKCLAKNRDDRYSSAEVVDADLALVAAGLAPLLEGNPVVPVDRSPPQIRFGIPEATVSKAKAVRVLAAIGCIAILFLAAFVFNHRQRAAQIPDNKGQVADELRGLLVRHDSAEHDLADFAGRVVNDADLDTLRTVARLIEESKKFENFDPDLLTDAYVLELQAGLYSKSLEKRRLMLKEAAYRCLHVSPKREHEYLCLVNAYQYVCTLIDPDQNEIYMSCVPELEAALVHDKSLNRKDIALVKFELAPRYYRLHRYKESESLLMEVMPHLEGSYLVQAKQLHEGNQAHLGKI